jgi:hypothetical protein
MRHVHFHSRLRPVHHRSVGIQASVTRQLSGTSRICLPLHVETQKFCDQQDAATDAVEAIRLATNATYRFGTIANVLCSLQK